MITVSELIGKQVLSLFEAKTIGVIADVIFDSKLKTIKLLKIFNDDETEAEVAYLEYKHLKSRDQDVCVISNDTLLTYSWNSLNTQNNPINSLCYNPDGKLLGKVTDVELVQNQIAYIIVGGEKLTPKNLLSISQGILVYNDSGKPVKLTKRIRAIPNKIKEEIKVVLHQTTAAVDIEKNDILYPIKVPQQQTTVSRSPQLNDSNKTAYSFLLGKTSTKTIYDTNQNILIKENTQINENTIHLAKQNGKLVQLALYAE